MSLPGLTWRILAHHRPTKARPADDYPALDLRFTPGDRVEFDELVVGKWLHVESTDDRSWYVVLGHRMFYITEHTSGQVVVTEAE